MPDKISDKNENPNGYQELENQFKYIVEHIKSFSLNTDKEHVAKAKQFLELAEKDAVASRLLLSRKKYALAVFHLEQSAEKTEKAIELFMDGRSIDFTDSDKLKDFKTHNRFANSLDEMVRFYGHVCPLAYEILNLILDNADNLVDCKSDGQKMKDIKKDASECYASKKAELWNASLNLETKKCNGIISFALDGLSNARLPYESLDESAINAIKVFQILDDEAIAKARIIQRLMYSLMVQIGLTILLALHEQETRYPPIANNDYWDEQAYTSDAPLIKKLSDFIKKDKESIKQLKYAISIYETMLENTKIH